MTKGRLTSKFGKYFVAAALAVNGGCDDSVYRDGKRVGDVAVEDDGLEIREEVVPREERVQVRQNYRTNDFSTDTDEVLLARMLYGEARNCSREEQIAIGYVALNRQASGRYGGRTLRGVILRPSQFSCFNSNDPNRNVIMNPGAQEFEPFVDTARGVINHQYTDNTRGATHYFNPRSANPSWANGMTQIGRVNGSRHTFYREH